MTEFATPEGLEHVDYYKSRRDNRVVAIHIHAGFDEFEAFPPFMESEEEREHIRQAYNVDPESERDQVLHAVEPTRAEEGPEVAEGPVLVCGLVAPVV